MATDLLYADRWMDRQRGRMKLTGTLLQILVMNAPKIGFSYAAHAHDMKYLPSVDL
jgi:hypothetical protein